MLLQNTLDLSTFEIVRFRIWNQTSNPNDYGIGTKYFNTNSGHEGYNRENIYTATGWRRTAYMDDIDKINDKLDLIFGDELDTDTIIDSWKEVQDFLSGIEDTKNLMTMLDGKLDKTGGTVTSQSFSPLAIKRDSTQGVSIRYENSSGVLGNIGVGMFEDGNHPIFGDGTTTYKLLHAGNVGDYTAGAANRLANKVSLWGNEFDGTQSLNGGISIKNSSGVYFANASGENVLAAYINSANKLIFGAGTNSRKYSTYIHGNNIYFNVGDPATTAMTITEEGNVLVGNVAENEGTPLKVSTRIHVSGTNQTAPSLGSAPTSGLIVGTNTLGINQWVNTSGVGNIQVGRFDGTATAYALNLNPLGGAVNIASADANTNVLGYLIVSQYLYMNSFLVMNHGKEGIYMTGTSINWHNANNAYTDNLLTFAKDSIKVHQLANFSNRVLIGGIDDDGKTALQVRGGVLVSAANTWQNETTKVTAGGLSLTGRNSGGYNQGVYFYNKNDVLIAFAGIYATGGADAITSYYVGPNTTRTNAWFSIDSTESAFNVLTKFNAGALIPAGQTLTIGSVTIKEVATGEIEVNGNLHATGTLASGGKGEAGENTTGNAMVYQYDLASGESVYRVDNVKGSTNVIVQIFEWNSNTSSWDMILTDVSVKADTITVTFGRTTTVNHMVTVC